MLIPCALICPFISLDLITLLYGQNFTASAPVLNVLAWVGVLIFYSLFFTSLAVSTGFVHFAYWDTATGAIISIALNYILIPRYSAFGSAVTALVCEIFLLSVTGYFVIKYFGNVIRWNRWAKVALANAILGALLYSLRGYFPLYLNIFTSLCLYAACVFLLKAIPKEEITAFLINMKTAERFKSKL
ncbi:MAG: polysaccharide biosynthesis C-terminal domain-containing protein [Syntrophales bacterium]